MRVITLYQPWATWIILGWKQIETRLHWQLNCLNGETIAIHAGKKYDKYAIDEASTYLTQDQIEQHKKMEQEKLYPSGAIIGTAYVYNVGRLGAIHSMRSLIDCGHIKRYGLFLKEIKPIEPIKVNGHQGIWEYPL